MSGDSLYPSPPGENQRVVVEVEDTIAATWERDAGAAAPDSGIVDSGQADVASDDAGSEDGGSEWGGDAASDGSAADEIPSGRKPAVVAVIHLDVPAGGGPVVGHLVRCGDRQRGLGQSGCFGMSRVDSIREEVEGNALVVTSDDAIPPRERTYSVSAHTVSGARIQVVVRIRLVTGSDGSLGYGC